MRVIERGDGARFALEAVAVPRRQLLDGDDAIEARVAGLVDLAHPARAEG
jgi:hypothetical protein